MILVNKHKPVSQLSFITLGVTNESLITENTNKTFKEALAD